MTEGGIAEWKIKEGQAFAAGDVLLEIETDKATIDVEAQEDGVLGKILAPDGSKNITVGKVIALLAEEGDDLSNLKAPAEESKPAAKEPEPSQPAPPAPKPASESQPAKPHSTKHVQHSRPLFPSVMRLLQEHNVPDPEKIKGTGVRGMLTKGDVLAHLGLASSPTGTYKEAKKSEQVPIPKKEEVKPLDGLAIRRLIVSNMLSSSTRAQALSAPTVVADFDSIIADYLPPSNPTSPSPPLPPQKSSKSSPGYLDGLI